MSLSGCLFDRISGEGAVLNWGDTQDLTLDNTTIRDCTANYLCYSGSGSLSMNACTLTNVGRLQYSGSSADVSLVDTTSHGLFNISLRNAEILNCRFSSIGCSTSATAVAIYGSATIKNTIFQMCLGKTAVLINDSSGDPGLIEDCSFFFSGSSDENLALDLNRPAFLSGSSFCGDRFDVIEGAVIDSGGNIFGVDCSLDCNANDIPDEADIANGDANDCNLNGQPDSCELADGLASDCDGNGVLDACDLDFGASDCNANGLLDVCETDCDADGLPDDCAIAQGDADCNFDGIPDACQIADGVYADANNDGILDLCQVMAFRGLETEIVAIEDRVLDTTIPATAVCYRLYATVNSAQASVLGIYGDLDDSLSIQSASGFWQFPFGGDLSSAVPCDESGQFPDLRYDSWLTLGATCASNDMTLGIGIDFAAFNAGGGLTTDDGIVFVDPDQPQSFPGKDGRVLIAQLTTIDGSLPTGLMNVFGMNPDGSDWIAAGVTWPEPDLVDCNGNGVQDAYDLATGSSLDCDGSGIPDECEFTDLLDCNDNGIADICDIADGTSADTNGDWIPDECACYGDATRDGLVNVDDIIKVVLSWGQVGESYADINGDLVVDGADLSAVLAAYGSCG